MTIMLGDFTALYLDEIDFKKAIEINQRFEVSYIPHLIKRI
jgi:hypothetical protein